CRLSYHPFVITLRDRTAATIEKQPVTVHREQEFVFTQEGRPTGGALERFRDLLLALPACRTMSWKAISRAETFAAGSRTSLATASSAQRSWTWSAGTSRTYEKPSRASSPSATVGGRHESA